MNRLVILLFGGVSTVAVAIVLWVMYLKADKVVSIDKKRDDNISFLNRQKDEPNKPRWLEKLAGSRKPSYNFPVTELFMRIPLNGKRKHELFFRFVISNLDPYKRFCVTQVLEHHRYRYAIYQKNRRAVVMIPKIRQAESRVLLEKIKSYDVKVELVPIKE